MTNDKNDGVRKTPLAAYVIVAAISAVLGYGGVTAVMGPAETSSGAPAATTAATAGNQLSRGEMQTFVFKKKPEAVPEFRFEDASGAARTLADWKGKVVLLNLWATWCAPCRKEMPALDRVQKDLGGDGFEVVALSVDRAGVAASKKFLEETKVDSLKLYVESTSKSIGTLRAAGLPTSILIDREGREVGRLAGPADWDSADAKRLIQSVLK